MALRPSSIPLRVPLPPPHASSLLAVPDPASDLARAVSPTISRLLATVVIDPDFASTAASALVAELLDFAATCRLEYATALFAESVSASPPSVRGECALGTDVLEDRQEDLECLAAAVPCFASTLLAPEGDPDAVDIATPRTYAEAITGPYSSQWQTAMDAEMASWKSTGTYVDTVRPSGANIVDGMWIFRGVDYFQTFSPTPKMTNLWVLLHVAAHRDYELHSLDFSTAFLQGSLHEEIWLSHPRGFTGSFPAGTQWSLRRPVYDLRQVPREWHNTQRTTLVAMGFTPSTADLSVFLRTDTLLPPFYVLVYITRDRARRTITLTQSHMVHQVLQRFGFQFSSPQLTPLFTGHSLSAPPFDDSVELSGPYPELVGCLMYLMTCTRPDLAYPLSLLARYMAPGVGMVATHTTVRGDSGRDITCERRDLDICHATSNLDLRSGYDMHMDRSGLGFESQCVHFGHPSAGGCQRSTGDPRLILGKGYRLVFLGGYGRTDLLLNKPFYPNVMPFGLTNAPSTFQLTMNGVFRDMLDKNVIVYLDEILVYSKTREEHLRDLEELFLRLQQNHLITKGSKCKLLQPELEFLGHVVSGEGIKIEPRKVTAISEWKPPTNITKLQSFLNFVNYVRRFVPNMAGVTKPLTDLLDKGALFLWGGRELLAFEELKNKLSSPPVLRLAVSNLYAIVFVGCSGLDNMGFPSGNFS
ncbi:unnamed protein product [Closterium sp. NIES-53]